MEKKIPKSFYKKTRMNLAKFYMKKLINIASMQCFFETKYRLMSEKSI